VEEGSKKKKQYSGQKYRRGRKGKKDKREGKKVFAHVLGFTAARFTPLLFAPGKLALPPTLKPINLFSPRFGLLPSPQMLAIRFANFKVIRPGRLGEKQVYCCKTRHPPNASSKLRVTSPRPGERKGKKKYIYT